MSNIKVDLLDIEYKELRDKLLSLIPTATPYWTVFQDSDPGIVMLSLVAALGDNFAYYLDKRTNEMILTRAQTKASILDHGKLFDYRLKRTTAPFVQVRVSPVVGLPSDTIIPRGSVFSTDSNTDYVVRDDVPILARSAETYIGAYQGRYYEDTFISDGSDIQTYELSSKKVASNFLDVYVKSGLIQTLWSEDQFTPPVDYDTFSKYLVDVDDAGVVTLLFNRFRYHVPQAGDTILVRYLATDGPSGAIPELTLNHITSSFTNSDYLNITNPVQSTAGELEEDFSKIKYKIPLYLSTLWRAVSAKDYENLARTQSGVKSVFVIQDPVESLTALVYIMSTIAGSEAGLIQPVQDFLQSYSIIGVKVKVLAAQPVPVDVSLTLVTQPRAIMSTVQQACYDIIGELLNPTNREIGQNLYVDDVYSALATVADTQSYKITNLAPAGFSDIDHILALPNQYISFGSVNIAVSGGI